jgi:surfeit locus 1 family protein
LSGGWNGIRIAGWQFRPGWLPTLVYVLLLVGLINLGNWQLDRAAEKREALAARAAATEAPVVALNDQSASLERHAYRRATAQGRFDRKHQFLLDNQTEDGRIGYRVITPLRLDGRDAAVLVQRGFVPIKGSRQALPELPSAPERARVSGRIESGPSVGMRLGDAADGTNQWPRRLQYIDFEAMQGMVDYPLSDYLLVEGSLATDAVAQRSERDAWRFGPERHEGYAVQWFSLAAALTLIWLVVNTRRNNHGAIR